MIAHSTNGGYESGPWMRLIHNVGKIETIILVQYQTLVIFCTFSVAKCSQTIHISVFQLNFTNFMCFWNFGKRD